MIWIIHYRDRSTGETRLWVQMQKGVLSSPFIYDVEEPFIRELLSLYKRLNSSILPGSAPEFFLLRNEMVLPFPMSNKI